MARLVVFSSSARGIPILRSLNESSHHVSTVIVTPNTPTQLITEITNLSLDYEIPEHFDDLELLSKLEKLEADIFVLAGFSKILSPAYLSLPSQGTVNLHAGKLPQYRGGSPLNWQLINGETYAGLSVVLTDSGIDTGLVLAEARIPITETSTIHDLHQEANSLFPPLLLGVIDQIRELKESAQSQDNNAAGYWHQRNDQDGKINVSTLSAVEVSRHIRALSTPYKGAWILYGDNIVRLYSAAIPTSPIYGTPGRIVYVQGNGPFIICKDKAILITSYHIQDRADTKLENGRQLT